MPVVLVWEEACKANQTPSSNEFSSVMFKPIPRFRLQATGGNSGVCNDFAPSGLPT